MNLASMLHFESKYFSWYIKETTQFTQARNLKSNLAEVMTVLFLSKREAHTY